MLLPEYLLKTYSLFSALVKATYGCRSTYCKSGKARVFLPTDLISVLGSNKRQALRAHDIMVAARDIGKKGIVDANNGWVNILGAMDVRLVTFIHNKKAGRNTYAPLEAIACVFFEELCARFPNVSEFPCPWVAVPLAATATPARGMLSWSRSAPMVMPSGTSRGAPLTTIFMFSDHLTAVAAARR